ncbi:UNVERIFIED_CONTAM: hypothetical protein FKN15_055299 [Acipenser sinensis]
MREEPENELRWWCLDFGLGDHSTSRYPDQAMEREPHQVPWDRLRHVKCPRGGSPRIQRSRVGGAEHSAPMREEPENELRWWCLDFGLGDHSTSRYPDQAMEREPHQVPAQEGEAPLSPVRKGEAPLSTALEEVCLLFPL